VYDKVITAGSGLMRQTSASSLASSQHSVSDLNMCTMEEKVPLNTKTFKSFTTSANISASHSQDSNLTADADNDNFDSNVHKPKSKVMGNFTNQNSSAVTALKERLKVAEKDVIEIRNENIRLKKMLVDTLSGGPPIRSEEFLSGNDAHLTSEKADNLADNIEVWRSKFLSSCILVEQLSKENQQHHEHFKTALEIFRAMKHEGSLSSAQFEAVNNWMRKAQSFNQVTNDSE